MGVGRATSAGSGPFFLTSHPTGSFRNVASTKSSTMGENFPAGNLGAGSFTMYCSNSRIDIWCPDPESETPVAAAAAAAGFRLFVPFPLVFRVLAPPPPPPPPPLLGSIDSRLAFRCRSASMMLSRFLSGRTGDSVSSPNSSSRSSASSAKERRASASSASSSPDEAGSSSAENGNRPMASSTSVIPSDQTSDLTV